MTSGRARQLSGVAAMILSAAREIQNSAACFVGVGTPSQAALVAARSHAPDVFLLYESGAIDTRPTRPPLSVADHDVVVHARAVIPVAEVFNCWLQGGHVDIGLVGAAEVDKFGNVNSTVIGDYAVPTVRLPGAGGAPTIGGFAGRTVVLTTHSTSSLVECVNFVTTPGRGPGAAPQGLPGAGVTTVVTDLGVLRQDPATATLRLTQRHPTATVEEIRDRTGWAVQGLEEATITAAPSDGELDALRSVLNDEQLHAPQESRQSADSTQP